MLNIGNLVVEGLDYICIVDKDYKIIYNTRYDQKISTESEKYDAEAYMQKNFFEAYPMLARSDSSVVKCLNSGDIVVLKNQEYEDYNGNKYITNNITVPLRINGNIVAAVELAMNIDGKNDFEKSIEEKKFDISVQKLVGAETGAITFADILTNNSDVKKTIERAKAFAKMATPTLIYGETGTGKEMFAQAMIDFSGTPKNKVLIQNCAAIPDNLMESFLFGTVKGAYTGAENKKGYFDIADGGILFLDELNSMSFGMQAKLLRVIQDGTFKPLGSSVDKKVNVKIIAAMNIDPMEAIEKNILRRDLFYRLSGGLIILTPLRERKEDIPLFIDYYMRYFSDLFGKNILGINAQLKAKMLKYDWPGNVRELKNAMEYMISAAPNFGMITANLLPTYLIEEMYPRISKEMSNAGDNFESKTFGRINPSQDEFSISYYDTMMNVEKNLITEALNMTHGNKTKASKLLGIPRKTLEYRIEKLKLIVKK